MLQRFVKESEGAVFIMVACGLMALVGAVGVAVDVGRGQLVRSKLQSTLDAAGLAAGASVNTTDLEAEVLKYMNVNFNQGTQGAVITDVDPVLNADGTLLTVDATATMPTTFMKIFGRDTMEVSAHTEVTRTNKGMELAMVLDITGSMCPDTGTCAKLTALKTASYDLLEILYGTGNTTADNLWIGIVPFSMAVNVGNSHTDWLDSGNFAARDWGTTSWRGCTEERWTAGRDLTDDTPATERFLAYYWQDDGNNNWREVDTQDVVTTTLCGPNGNNSCRCTTGTGGYTGGTRVCGTTQITTQTSRRIYCTNQTSSNNRRCSQEDTTQHDPIYTYDITSSRGPNTYCPTNEVTRLTNSRTTLETAINALQANGGTHIPVGAVWGWRLLSPEWRGLWGGGMNTNNLPLDYDAELMIKAMILMTDGENTMYHNADGAYGYTQDNHVDMDHHAPPFTSSDNGAAALKLNEKLSTICTNMKERGIIVYTVVFDLSGNTAVDTMMRNCASQPDYYFNSPNAAALKQAFRTIGDSLANLRISK